MAGSAVPDVIDAIVVVGQELFDPDDVSVYDGRGVTDNPGDFLMIGVDDPDSDEIPTSATSDAEWATTGLDAELDEDGYIDFCAMSWNGDGDLPLARRTAYLIASTFAEAVRGVGELIGLENVLWLRPGPAELKQAQSTSGARAIVHQRIYYKARI